MSSRKKILFFVPLPPPITGAGLRNKSLVESRLLNDSFLIKVIPFNFAGEVDDIGRFSISKIIKSIGRAFLILSRVITFKPHLVYFNFSLYGFALYRDTLYTALFKILGCRLLFHLRTQGVKKQIRESVFKRMIFRFVFRNSHVICLSGYMARDIEDVYKGEPIIVNNGIEDVSPRFPTKNILSGDIVSILFVGHLWKFKGIIELIDALKILKSDGVNFNASIVGPEGDLLVDDLKKMIEVLGLNDSIQILGTKEGDEKHQIFRDADIFVLPTHWEAFPGVVLEAMQFSLPVIATREGAIPEIIDDEVTGLLIRKQDAADLAEKLRRLVADPKLRESMGGEGRLKFVRKYSLNLFEQNIKEAFDHVLDVGDNK